MANRSIFNTIAALLPANTRNEAGGSAYALPPKVALAVYALTGCFNGTYYTSDSEQLKRVSTLCSMVEPRFIAQLAVYAREHGSMKDMPAYLCSILSVRDGALLQQVFPRVIDSPRVLRTFVQIMRSGAVNGRRSLGSRPKRLVREWLEARSLETLMRSSIGQSPSLADVIRMVHPRPSTPEREAFYAYLIGRPHDARLLPALVREYEEFKRELGSQAPARSSDSEGTVN